MFMYTLEKFVDGEWIKEGEWTDVKELVNVAFYLGKQPEVKKIRVQHVFALDILEE